MFDTSTDLTTAAVLWKVAKTLRVSHAPNGHRILAPDVPSLNRLAWRPMSRRDAQKAGSAGIETTLELLNGSVEPRKGHNAEQVSWIPLPSCLLALRNRWARHTMPPSTKDACLAVMDENLTSPPTSLSLIRSPTPPAARRSEVAVRCNFLAKSSLGICHRQLPENRSFAVC